MIEQPGLFDSLEVTKFYFASRDSSGGIRGIDISYSKIGNNHYVINRYSYKYHCKHTLQPPIDVDDTDLGRDAHIRVQMRVKSLCKEYIDKGYKQLEKSADDYSVEELDNIVGFYKTYNDGLLKPMLCKMAKNVTNKATFDLPYFASRKINGVRTLIYYDGKEVHAKSRTAISLDFPLYHIISHPLIKKLFKSNPNLILDGEAYKHGLPLATISGICRNNSDAKDLGKLEFYMYDIVDINLSFIDRLKKMIKIKKLLNLDFNPYRFWKEGDLKIQFVPQVPVSGWDNIMKLHNQYIEEGWEGLVIRLATAKYGPGKRNNNMIKVKIYKENTFKCIGIEQGLRKYDDMVFIMQLRDGRTFKAKPLGDHEQKVEYTDNFDKFYKNKLGDCKYFDLSPYGIPEQPAFIAFRFDLTEADLHD